MIFFQELTNLSLSMWEVAKCTIETKEILQGIAEQSVRLEKGSLIFKGVDMGSILLIHQISGAVKNYLLH